MKLSSRIKPQVILFDGVSGVGKSMFLNFLKENYEGQLFVGTKLTTRERRDSDNNWEFKFLKQLPSNYEFSFPSVGNFYAINKEEIEEKIRNGFTYVVTCTDRATVEKIKNKYAALVIYIYRNFTINEFNALILKKDSKGKTKIEERVNEFDEISTLYYENIDLYDHVILNIDSTEASLNQLIKILSLYGFTFK
jgi:guanylate kinase